MPLVVAVVALAIAAAYHFVGKRPEAGRSWDGDPATLMSSHKGRVLVLLLGMEGCPGTRAATEFLGDYIEEMPEGASVVRLDVPPPDGQTNAADAAKLPVVYGVDRDRLVADTLEFFYYPTLYVLDGDGEVRFSGECDPERVPQMVAEILAEKPGDKKHVYTPPLPAAGTAAPSFTGVTLAGDVAALDGMRGAKGTVLVFATTACPFSVGAMPAMQQLAEDFRGQGVAVIVVNWGEAADVIQPIYADRAPGLTVIVDEAREISGAYNIGVAPFAFVLDADGKVAARMPYTLDDATRAVNVLLGLAEQAPTIPSIGAG
ncbi:MAG: redoxin domain-containing protein [Verrucomicrobia bacterium]|nr:redoxin domain-containing protein [Verrucomicrobiota bacterium]